MVPTLMGVVLVTFTVAQFVPKGPVEKLVAELEGVGSARVEMFSVNSLYRGNSGLSAERVEKLRSLNLPSFSGISFGSRTAS